MRVARRYLLVAPAVLLALGVYAADAVHHDDRPGRGRRAPLVLDVPAAGSSAVPDPSADGPAGSARPTGGEAADAVSPAVPVVTPPREGAVDHDGAHDEGDADDD